MSTITALLPEQLYRRCDPAILPFNSTAQIDIKPDWLGQERVFEAVKFAVGMRHAGFNLFVMGEPGAGRRGLISRFLTERAHGGNAPDDWCYVNNFDTPSKPVALRLPHGQGSQLRDDLQHLVKELQTAIPAMFEGEEYLSRVDQIDTEFNERQKNAFIDLANDSETQSIALLRTPEGFSFAPEKNGEVMSSDDYEKLSDSEKEDFKNKIAGLQQKLEKLLQQVLEWRKEHRNRLHQLNQEVTIFAVGSLVEDIVARYADQPDVVAYLEAVKKDVIENAHIFRKPATNFVQQSEELPPLRRYQVNLLVDGTAIDGAPIVAEDNPTFQNLLGRVEHVARFGALITDFVLIRPGALHRANGGYLLLDIHKLLEMPFAWEGLKRALTQQEIRIESIMQMVGMVSTVSLEPQPIPLDVKIVLIGERIYYYLLQAYDPEFAKLFKVAADFEDDIVRTDESQLGYVNLVATLVQQHRLLPFERDAVARIVEFSARDADDAGRLSLHLQRLSDLLREAEYWATSRAAVTVSASDIQQAIDAKFRRSDRIKRRLEDEIIEGTIMIDTDGAKVGQINALSVLETGDYTFGQPTRVTATTRLGDGEVIDIQREVALGGALHSKGVLILSSFLASRYSARQPLSLNASLVFEQTYGHVEGDSASLAELCALLSSLAEIPIRQSLAITGSVNQYGEAQAIGGVNEKIEGFFDLCKARGLNGKQGVLIPAANVRHLMLRADVVEAARQGLFQVYPIEHVDQAVELLTGVPAGQPDAVGNFAPETINQRVRTKLAELLHIRMNTALTVGKKRRYLAGQHHTNE
ncbi:MAG: ATP-binding protein [Burkholderiaceae bacterium]|nr:ATP-binding protein [Burkholderiaceae bacterium]